MSRRPFDPLARIPSPDAILERLNETLTLAQRLKILLEVAERIRDANPISIDEIPTIRKGVADE